MNPLLRSLLSLWVRIEVRPEESIARIGTVPAAPVCYVMERRSRVDLGALEIACGRHGLPPPGGRILGRGGRAVGAALPLLRQRGLFDARIERRPPPALAAMIEAVRADPGFDVRLVPVAVYWGRAPQKEGSWLRLLLSENWALGSSLRKALQVVFNGRFTMLELGEPRSLRSLLDPILPAPEQSARLAREMRARFRRQRASRIGPDLSHRRTIVARVLSTRAVRAAVAQEMRERKLERRKALLVARGYAEEIAANYSHAFVTFMEGLLTRLWNRLYDGVVFGHVETLREATRDDREIVFVPCHRSHMDYLLLSYAIYRQGYAIPHIAAGINLDIPLVGRFLRKGGAFFIRRSFGGNALYTVVFMKYLATIMGRGHSIEYFIEGGRSRTGRLLQPRTGMLSMTVRSYLRDPKRPVVFLPVYFGYERVVEAGTYIGELSGRPKQKESILDLLRFRRVLREKFGRVHVNLGEPIHLDGLLDRFQPGWRGQRFDEDTRAGWVSRLVDDLATRIMCHINGAAAVTPINLLAVTLLATPRRAMAVADLERQVDFYLALLRDAPYGARMTLTPLSAPEVISYGESMKVLQRQAHKLGDVVRMGDESAVLMTYYRNNVLHLFALPSLIACAFISNAEVPAADIQRLVWRIYPYVATELFLKWTEEELPGAVDAMLQALARQGILEAADDGLAWRRPPPTSPRAVQLSLLAQSTIQTIERYYLAIALLIQAGSGVLTAKGLAERCQLMAQRIAMLYGFDSPEFSDRALFDNFIALLTERQVLQAGEGGKLQFDEVLGRVAADAEYVLSEQIRHSILQVTHA
ncbi:MAG: glycerol-3-phosphate 1-O-acyltransferase PlsB [Steroidobacteraceae bacterium]|jgi:glycerol-3-phosphate O-acyltransferase|nr:glycerol-3-phosphate 1-O-acyltransferase PlsB [Steroidobacteraceae bacterium]